MSVTGPAWTEAGAHESPGRYPLRVEGAVSRLVDQLLPGVITTTRHARMYALHTLVWIEAQRRNLSAEEAQELARRCEAVTAAIHVLHTPHQVKLSVAHGEDRIRRFLDDERLDVERAARLGGLSRAGFAGVYQGPCTRIGALAPTRPPRPGPRADTAALRDGLGELLPLAVEDTLSTSQLLNAGHLCLCEASEASDGRWLRRLIVDEDRTGRPDDTHRRLTCLLLLDALDAHPGVDPTAAFCERWAFGAQLGGPRSERAAVAAGWRAAILRNYSIGAWRWLWKWLTDVLRGEPMTAVALGRRIAAELEPITVGALIESLPPRVDGSAILAAEQEIADRDWTPTDALRQLALGASRLRDLDDFTCRAFVGSDPADLGPRWVATLLEEHRNRPLAAIAPDLVQVMVQRARRVALSKMHMARDGRPFIPSRLRDRDGILSVHGEEGAGEVALRIDSLAQILAGLGLLRAGAAAREVVLTGAGEVLRAAAGD